MTHQLHNECIYFLIKPRGREGEREGQEGEREGQEGEKEMNDMILNRKYTSIDKEGINHYTE